VYPPKDVDVSFGPEQAEQGKEEEYDQHPPKYELIGYGIPGDTPEDAVSEAMRRISIHIRSRDCPQEWLTRFQKAREADMFHVHLIGTENSEFPELKWTVFQGSDGLTAWDEVDFFKVVESRTDDLENLINQVNEQTELTGESLPEDPQIDDPDG